MKIEFEVEDAIAYALAVGSGWTPMIEDTSQEIVGDSYPMIQNPVSVSQYVTGIISKFLKDHVLREGRKRVANEIDSIKASIEHQIKQGVFDQAILANDIDGIKQAMLAGLISG